MSDIVIVPEKNLEIIPISQPDRLLEMAISNGADMAQIEKFLDLKERYDKEQARKAYHASFSDFKLKIWLISSLGLNIHQLAIWL